MKAILQCFQKIIYIYIYFLSYAYLLALDYSCSMFPKSTNETFAQKLYQTFKDHKRFSKPKLAHSDFTICHYAGDVCCDFDNLITSEI